MDRLDELSLLAAIIEEGNLVGAGRRLGQSAPAVTRILAGLEERVGARLIERTTRRALPTELGLRLAERGRALLAEYEEAVSTQAGAPLQGLLRITAPVRFGCRHVSPVVSSFLDAHPALRIELVLDDAILNLVAEHLDVGIRLDELADSSLALEGWARCDACWWRARPTSPAAARRPGWPISRTTTLSRALAGWRRANGGSDRATGRVSCGSPGDFWSRRWRPSAVRPLPAEVLRGCPPIRSLTRWVRAASSGYSRIPSPHRCPCTWSRRAGASWRQESGPSWTTPPPSCGPFQPSADELPL